MHVRLIPRGSLTTRIDRPNPDLYSEHANNAGLNTLLADAPPAQGASRGDHDDSQPRNDHMRYLGLDLGDRRTGVALGDSQTGIATPVEQIEVAIDADHGRALLDEIVRAAREHLGAGHGEIVIGLPLNMDGSEGPRARAARAAAERIAERTARRVHLFDERLTSAEADWTLAQSGYTRAQKKQRRDALAAAAILRGFLSQQSPQEHDA